MLAVVIASGVMYFALLASCASALAETRFAEYMLQAWYASINQVSAQNSLVFKSVFYYATALIVRRYTSQRLY